MIIAEAMRPLGLAIKDFYAGDNTAEVKLYRDDGTVNNLAISAFFRGATDFQLDKIALDNCRGRILDVGAGVGIHSLYLQKNGLSVWAMDVSPEACQVMRQRGIKKVKCASFADFQAEPFDTLLILGRSICMVETLDGLHDFLVDARRLVENGGQILLNSLDVTRTKDPQNIAYHQANKQAGRYFGEIRVHLEYKETKGPAVGMLHVDQATLSRYAADAGWTFDVLLQEQDGNYLAVLVKKEL